VQELEHSFWGHCMSDLAHGGKGRAEEFDKLGGEVYAISDQIGMHCREPHVTKADLADEMKQMAEVVESIQARLTQKVYETRATIDDLRDHPK
jgi:hypothetical protein